MSLRNTRAMPAKAGPDASTAQFLRIRFRTLEMPMVRDGIVMGKRAPISPDAMMETLKLVSTDRFSLVPVFDDVVGGIIVREGLLRRMHFESIAEFVVTRVKPYMSLTEVLRLDIEVDTLVETLL